MTGGAADEVDRKARAAFPGLAAFDARLVSFEPSPDLDKHRAKLVTLVREIGLVQTGRGVDMLWVKGAIQALAAAALGVTDFDFVTESHPEALRAVTEAATRQLAADRAERASATDTPF